METQKFDNTNRGMLKLNDRKEQEKHPDYKGQINVAGQEFWLSGWKKTNKQGEPFLSLSIQPKEQKGAYQGKPSYSQGAGGRGNAPF